MQPSELVQDAQKMIEQSRETRKQSEALRQRAEELVLETEAILTRFRNRTAATKQPLAALLTRNMTFAGRKSIAS
jgi:hypothetical protein